MAKLFGLTPWELCGGDPWCTYDELDAFYEAAEEYVKANKEAAEKAKRKPARRRR